jgi:hypothetical protein
MGTIKEELEKIKLNTEAKHLDETVDDLPIEEECEHDDVDDGYCLDCGEPAHEFMDADYFVDRAKDFD